jgi:hypothetical protein
MKEMKSYEQFLNEKKNASVLSMEDVPQGIVQYAESKKKTADLEGFVNNFPTGDSPVTAINILFSLISQNNNWTKEFVDSLWTLKDPSQVSPKMYSSGSLGERIFEQEPKGMGRGEIFLSWLIKNSSAQGGGESFDLTVGGSKYEVKDYRSKKSPNKPIRLGTKGKATRFFFWKQIIETISRINKLIGVTTGQPKFDFNTAFKDKDFVNVVNYIIGRENMITGGEFNRTDLANFKAFYEKVATVEFAPDVYTNVIIRGPGVKPIEISIEPLSPDAVGGKTITLTPKPSVDQSSYLLTEIRRLDYARNPKNFEADMQKAVNEIVGTLPFIVFRNNAINITTDFVFYSVSQSGVTIIEKSIADSGAKVDEE